MREKLRAWTKEGFEEQKALLEKAGYVVTNNWRKGCKSIRLAPIVLSEWKAEAMPLKKA